MQTKTIILVIIILILLIFGSVYFLNKPQTPNFISCTMEAKLCPDGSYVGRTGPNCEFEQCPVLTAKNSGIKGTAMLGPICPVMKNPPDPKCADRPYATNLVATMLNQPENIKEFSSDFNGKFSVDLPAGEYTINSADTAKMFSRCSSDGAIKVEKDKYTEITLNCDTGIR